MSPCPIVQSEPELVQRMIDEGHIVGNHSVNHPSFPEISLEECQQEIMELHDYVKENFGYEMSLFRFPMGEFSEADLKVVQDLGYRSVFWSFAYRDWLVDEQPDPQEAIATIEDKCHPGAIYLLHAVSETNAQILGQVIDDLPGEGYGFLRLSVASRQTWLLHPPMRALRPAPRVTFLWAALQYKCNSKIKE